MRDAVDEFMDQWAAQRTDLDLDAMGTVGRILRLARLVNVRLKDYFTQYDMETWEFDVLATLRRSGQPLTAKALAGSIMIGSAALTNRIDRLVARGLVTRESVPGDRRSLHIALTDEGRELVDRVVEGHVQNQRKILAGLTPADREDLTRVLRTLLVSLGDTR
ncbi:MarR family transcriptional regulator [Streptomyces griseorubiginosus]|uniref:MarR family winged helix-turn-helix transcriptional regulator n=1 Tax=Streptomyces griseorubiginosus TaxID=67304 RepID=UPI002E80F617|nr:MarR family transcriptional regulator [Streptomyces griseorubiginosus]WUB47371.1 MarR family transcriptional regulator [Streptomyces griseorubiginosus]WUB55895.1 MarR family transcriptional regulator [Streptomyces griseorubiginosus]